ncbi:hypothetical protein ACF06W_14195 [Streptomyces albus]|uniref:hypothetical protein n=1 Tax=Streptomyces albus TaxID=1888 RepID=UPI0036F555CB
MRITDCERANMVVSGARGENARQAAAPGQFVAQAQRLLGKAEELLEHAVIAERARNTSWEQIGQALGGLSKSSAHKRYGSAYSKWSEHADGMSTEDEDTGEEINGEYVYFLIAYALLERTWGEIEEVVADQELLNDLRNATLAASGQSAPTDGRSDEVRAAYRALVQAPRPNSSFTYADSGKTRALSELVAKHPRYLYGKNEPTLWTYLERAYLTDTESGDLEARLAALERRVERLEGRSDER